MTSRIFLTAAEVLHEGGGESRFSQFAVDVLHSDQQSATNARIFQLAVDVLHSDQSSIPNAQIFQVAVDVLHSDQSSIKNAQIFGVGVEVLTSTVQQVSPRIVQAPNDSQVFAPTSAGIGAPEKFLIDDRERNPFPTSSMAVDVDEQQRILRQQHNYTQAGDSTFDFGLLLKPTPDQLYTLGSLGKFYHDDYGIIHARFVQFVDWVTIPYQGCPVGRLASSETVDWVVTNDFDKSGADLIVGIAFFGVDPNPGEYGWVVVDGANPAAVQVSTATLPAPDTPYVWTTTGTLGVGVTGKVAARRWGKAINSLIEPGSILVRVEGLSSASFIELINEQLEPVTQELGALTVRVGALETSTQGLATSTTSLQQQIQALSQRLTTESQTRARDIQSVREATAPTDWTTAINESVDLLRGELSDTNNALTVQVANAEYLAQQALEQGGSNSSASEIEALTNQFVGLAGRLTNFAVDYPLPAANDVLLAVLTPGTDGNDRVHFEGVQFALQNLVDVDVTTTPPTDGQQLTWDSALQKWVPDAAGSGGGGGITGIEVRDEGSLVHASTAKVNFTGAGVTVTDDGAGGATVTVPGATSGGLGWTLAGSWTHSVNVSVIPFINLGDYEEILVFARGLTASASTQRAIQLSSDNGLNYLSGAADYVTMQSGGSAVTSVTSGQGAFFPHSSLSTLARGFIAHLTGFNQAMPTFMLSNSRAVAEYYSPAVAVNALRIVPISGTNPAILNGTINGGTIEVYGR